MPMCQYANVLINTSTVKILLFCHSESAGGGQNEEMKRVFVEIVRFKGDLCTLLSGLRVP